MANGKVGVEIANLEVMCNGMTGRADVGDRFLFQWAHPVKQDDNPLMSFTVPSLDGPVPAPEMSAAAPGGVVFAGQKFTRKPGEPLELVVHHYLDMRRDLLQIALGKLVEHGLDALLGGVSVGSISLASLIDATSSLKLAEEIYSLAIGVHSVALQPLTLAPGGTALAFATTAPADVFAFGPIGPAGAPPRIKVVSATANTARMTLIFNRA